MKCPTCGYEGMICPKCVGKKGGQAGKGSEARRQAAIKANKARWDKETRTRRQRQGE